MKRSEPLDGLRGVAVLLVLLSHSSNAGYDVIPGVDASGVGRAGVFLFFVLSSFLLTSQVLARTEADEPVGWRRFALRRLLRVLPAYAVCMAVHVALGVFTPEVALRHLAFVRGEAHFWTIPVEVLFYLSLPALALALGVLPGTWSRAAALVASIAALSWAAPPDYPARAPDFLPNVLPFMPVFLTGSLLAVLAPVLGRAGGVAGRAVVAAGVIGALILVALTPSVASMVIGEPVPHRRFHLWFLEHAGLWSLLLAAAVVPAGRALRAALAWRPLTRLGRISYSVYLYHGMGLAFAAGHPLADTAALVGLEAAAASVLLGTVSYVLVERTGLRFSRGGGAAAPPSLVSDGR